MNLRPLPLLCASLLLAAAALPAQAPPTPATPPAPVVGPAAQPGAQTMPPRRVPEGPYIQPAPVAPGDLTTWPRGVSPAEVGKALAEHFVTGTQGARFSGYPYVCTFYGAMTFAALTHDDALRDRLIALFDPMLPGGTGRQPQRHHVDDSIFGVMPLEIAIQTKALPTYDPKYLQLGISWADRQWAPPTPGITYPEAVVPLDNLQGLSPETRFWVDDMYMLNMLQLEAYRATGDRKYLDRDAHEMVAYLDRLQQPNGLFFHAPDVKYFWGRGDGWFAAGMAEMLRTLPADHPDRPRILSGYKLMMAALQLRHVQFRAHHRRQARLAGRRHLRARRTPRMDRRHRLRRPEPRRHPGLHRNRQARQHAVLPRPQARDRKPARPGTRPVGRRRPAARREVILRPRN